MSIISGFILPCSKKIYIALRTVVLAIASNTYYLIKYLLFLPKNMKQELIEKPEMEHPVKAFGWAARDSSGILAPFKFSRRATGDHDVQLKILYCGICHSDLHSIKNDGGVSTYPQVPGHEITGIVTEVGSKVKKFKVGDKVGVGCMVGSCRNCDQCVNNLENYCPIKPVFTYNSIDFDGTRTHGGYSNIMVANEHFVIRWPESLPLDTGAPLLCAGTTTYSAMKYYGLDKPGLHVGVVGLGGLGHVAVKFLKAFGAKVTVISTSASKKDDAVKTLGLDGFLVSRNEEEMNAAAATLDGIIDTVSAVHPIGLLVGLLKTHGKMVVLGVPEKLELPVVPIVLKRKMVGGSLIGGLKETQEMIDFAAEHKIVAEVEIIPMDYVNKAMERLAKADVKYRFVIDVGKTAKAE